LCRKEAPVADSVRIELGDWPSLRARAEPVRFAVFVEEQRVPMEIELDEFDPVSVHALALAADGTVLGTGRLLPDGHIGRVAVLRQARGAGVGSALLTALMDAARARGDREVVLSAQTHAMPFYARFDFVAEGEDYDDAGIPHRQMRLVF
jgi:predicted GNAT family N-acyltransferase